MQVRGKKGGPGVEVHICNPDTPAGEGDREGQVQWCTSVIMTLLQLRGRQGRPGAVVHICNHDTLAGERETEKARWRGAHL